MGWPSSHKPQFSWGISMDKFIVATRHIYGVWDNLAPALVEARAQYDAGTHEMFQARRGDLVIQYCQPRRVRKSRRPYFGRGLYR